MAARIVSTLPRKVRTIEHTWIPMPDGSRLAARLWLPDDSETSPVPGILEYIPYRKRDGTRSRDEPIHSYFAGHGYASVRVDVRGTGESEGLLTDEYTEQELHDGVHVIEWIAAQPWCTGTVGMIGKSWGGFNALQVAALAPPQLGAIITVCSTDDRYRDDAHYMGGCLLNENLIWGSTLMTLNALPPDPELMGEGWRDTWLQRLEEMPLFVERWLRHPLRDAYWKHGSVCEDFSRITCPVYAVGGWADGYANAVPRLLSGLTVPRKGLLGPWAHVYPHQGVPGPAIGFLQEALRWWDYWLKGISNGIMDEPTLSAWMQESVKPLPLHTHRPGRWIAEATWPPPSVVPQRSYLNWRRLDDHPDTPTSVTHQSPQTVGLSAGSWCGFGVEGETPTDQRDDDGKSLTFDTLPLTHALEILGAPVLHLWLRSDKPHALVAVRLNELHPDGTSTRVTYGLLNLTHRNGNEQSEPLQPGEEYHCRVELNHTAHAFSPNHRIRVAVSTAYWPLVWPSPDSSTITIALGKSYVELPVRRQSERELPAPSFLEPEHGPLSDEIDLHPGGASRTTRRDITSGETVYHSILDVDDDGKPAMTRMHGIDMDIGHAVLEEFRIREHDPLSASAQVTHHTVRRRGAWMVRVDTITRMHASVDAFHLDVSLEAHEGEDVTFSKQWRRSVPRDGV